MSKWFSAFGPAPGQKPFALFPTCLYGLAVSKKNAKVARLIEDCQGRAEPAHYLAYFECFNRQLFYEAHDVLEELWLAERGQPNADFYKGLIQVAGAFVHLQKNRLRPGAALLKLAAGYLGKYPSCHLSLDLGAVRQLMAQWLTRLEEGDFLVNPLTHENGPQLAFVPSTPHSRGLTSTATSSW